MSTATAPIADLESLILHLLASQLALLSEALHREGCADSAEFIADVGDIVADHSWRMLSRRSGS